MSVLSSAKYLKFLLPIVLITSGLTYSQSDVSAGEKILSHFQCAEGTETAQVNLEMNKLKNLATELNQDDSQCASYGDRFSDIPEVETLIDQMFNNSILNQIKQTEKEIEDLEDQLTYIITLPVSADERNWLPSESEIQNRIYVARGQIIQYKQDLKYEEAALQNQNASNRIYEVERYFENLTSAIEADCFKDNQAVATSALSSMAGIAGLFVSSPWGLAVTVGSKLISKVVSLGSRAFKAKKRNKMNKIIEPLRLMAGVECAVKSFSQGQCRLLNKSHLYNLIEGKEMDSYSEGCTGGVAELSVIQGAFDNATQVLTNYRANINNLSAGDAKSDNNIVARAQYDQERARVSSSLNAYKRRFETQLRENEVEPSVLKSELGNSTLMALERFFGGIENNDIKRNQPELFLKGFLNVLYGKNGSIDELYSSLKEAFLNLKKNQWLDSGKSAESFNPTRHDRVNSGEMYAELNMEYYDRELGSLKTEAPPVIGDIFEKLGNPQTHETILSNLGDFGSKFKSELEVKSSKIGDINRNNKIQVFNSRLGSLDGLSPIEAMDELIGMGENIVGNRELLKKNMQSKKTILEKEMVRLSDKLTDKELSDTEKNNIEFMIKVQKNKIAALQKDMRYSYDDLVDSVASMREARGETLEKWEKYQEFKESDQLSADDALRKMRGETVVEKTKINPEEFKSVENDFVNSINKFMNYDISSASAGHFLIIGKHLSLNSELWGEQLDNLFEIPKENDEAFFILRSNVYKDYKLDIAKFQEDKKDIDRAMANSTVLIEQNSLLFSPYLDKVSEKLNEIKEFVEPGSWGNDSPKIKEDINENRSYKVAQVKQMKDFCLNILAASSLNEKIKESCSDVEWRLPSGAKLTFRNEAEKDFESRVCIPKMISDASNRQLKSTKLVK